MGDELHLIPRHRGTIQKLLDEHLPGVEVWAYGSRVSGRSHDASDLDLAPRAWAPTDSVDGVGGLHRGA